LSPFFINIKLNKYEVIRPIERTNPKDEISLNEVNISKKKENDVVKQEIKTASLDFSIPLILKIE